MRLPTLLEVSLASAILAALVYVTVALRNRRKVDLRIAIECLINGSGVPGGLFLMVSAFLPDWLGRVVNGEGLPVTGPGFHVEVESEKRLAILIGGFAIEFLAVANLLTTYAKQRRSGLRERQSGQDSS